jgi:hypothetical protein
MKAKIEYPGIRYPRCSCAAMTSLLCMTLCAVWETYSNMDTNISPRLSFTYDDAVTCTAFSACCCVCQKLREIV